jgi:hypothetical protein
MLIERESTLHTGTEAMVKSCGVAEQLGTWKRQE